MPYICKSRRETIRDGKVRDLQIETPGELNFAITELLIGYVEGRDVGYSTVAEALSACTEAAAEFRRRVLVPLEERKMSENGDVLPRWLLWQAATGAPWDGGVL